LHIIEEGEGDDYTKLIEIRLGPNIGNKEIFQAGGHKGRFGLQHQLLSIILTARSAVPSHQD
jgi:hypothetical protein